MEKYYENVKKNNFEEINSDYKKTFYCALIKFLK